MADASLINIGLSGVRAHQAALATTGQNITNASTPGYTRQVVNLETITSNGHGIGAQGVAVQGVQRVYDAAAVNQIRLDTSASSRYDELLGQLSQVDNLLADEASSLNRGFERFFAALHSAANEPSSLPARQLVMSEAEGLVARFQALDGRLRDQLTAVNRQAESEISTINELAAGIADLNARLGPMREDDPNTNALLDQRDEMLRQLSEHVDIKTTAEGLGMNVFIGKGQSLVVGANATRLEMSTDGQLQIRTRNDGSALPVTVHGGSLGGLLSFRDQTLEGVNDELGRLALSFSATVNQVHQEGLSLRGEYGGSLFSDVNSASAQAARVQAANPAANTSSVDLALRVDDPAALAASDYRVTFDGDVGAFTVRRDSDGAVVASTTLGSARPVELSFDGLTLVVGEGQVTQGASYSLTAAGSGVANLGVALADPRDLALASPLSVRAGDRNQGTGQLSVESVTDVTDPLFSGADELVPPLLVRFTSATCYEVLDNSDPTNPVALSPPLWGLPFVPGGEQPLFPGEGQQLLVSDGRDTGALPAAATASADLTAPANTLGAETIRLLRSDATFGQNVEFDQVDIQAGMSARAIAAALNEADGVSAAARTELRLSGLRDNGIGEPLTVAVNGEALTLAAGSGLADLADAVSGSSVLAAAGITAVSDGNTLTLSSSLGDDISLHVSGDVSDGLTLEDPYGATLDLNGSGPGGGYQSATVAGSVRLLMSEGISVQSDSGVPAGGLFSAAPLALSAALGFQATISGRPEAGDSFAIQFNDAGNLDNHNALALADLQISPSLGDPPVNFSEAYASIVELVGIRTNQARSDASAAEGLLQQSVARRDSLSGVNLDEEAANLIKYEQGYNASARVISVANEIFDALLGAVA